MPRRDNPPPPTLAEVVDTLHTLGGPRCRRLLERWLDALDATGRWALLKLVTGGLRIGVSARLAKQAVAELGGKDANEIEEIWHGLSPPYVDLFAWLEGRGEQPVDRDPAPFRPVMLAHAIEDGDFASLDPADFAAEWKWDGIRVQAVAGATSTADRARLYSRTGDDISGAFPISSTSLRSARRASTASCWSCATAASRRFGDLQQRLNRKTVSPKLMQGIPRPSAPTICSATATNDLRELPFAERRARLEAFVAQLDDPRIDLSPLVAFDSWDELDGRARRSGGAGAGDDAEPSKA